MRCRCAFHVCLVWSLFLRMGGGVAWEPSVGWSVFCFFDLRPTKVLPALLVLLVVQDQETVIQLATAASRCDHVGRFLLRATRAR